MIRKHLRVVAAFVTLASIAVASDASAQMVATPSPGLPSTMVIPLRPGDGSTTTGGLPIDFAMLPLRLSFDAGRWPSDHEASGCLEKAEQNGSTVNFFSQNRAAAIHLIPNLTLVGFSTTSCALDARANGGLVYTTPIRKNLWLVGSIGTTISPTTTLQPKPPRPRARVDLVWQSTPTQAFTFGVGRRGVMVGAAF